MRDRYNIKVYGTYADMPAASTDMAEVEYVVTSGTNAGKRYYCNGSAWVELSLQEHVLDPDGGPHTGTLPKAQVAGLKIDCQIFVQDTDPALVPENNVVHGDIWIQRHNDNRDPVVERSYWWTRYVSGDGETERWDSMADRLDGYSWEEFMLNALADQYASAVGASHSYQAKTAVLSENSALVGGLSATQVMLLSEELFGD